MVLGKGRGQHHLRQDLLQQRPRGTPPLSLESAEISTLGGFLDLHRGEGDTNLLGKLFRGDRGGSVTAEAHRFGRAGHLDRERGLLGGDFRHGDRQPPGGSIGLHRTVLDARRGQLPVQPGGQGFESGFNIAGRDLFASDL
jgi:hypothetical protein